MGLLDHMRRHDAPAPVTVSMTARVTGKSPAWTGIGVHIYDPSASNVGSCLSHLGVNQVRTFFGLLPDVDLRNFLGKDVTVTNAQQFNFAVQNMNTVHPQLADRFEKSGLTAMAHDLNQRNISIILQLSGPTKWTFSTFDPNTAAFWSERWELYKYTYSVIRLSTEQGIKIFEVYNEPDIMAKGKSDPPLVNAMISRIQVVSLAASNISRDIRVIGPTLGRSQVPLNTDWLDPILRSQHEQLGTGHNPQWNNLHGISYHRYAGGGEFFANLADNYQKEIVARLGTPMPLYVTEFNIHTAKDWDGRCDNPDTPERMTRFIAQAVAMVGKVYSTTAFCMAQYPNKNMQCGVNKNGIHFIDSSGCNITGKTLSADAYRLFTKAFAGEKDLYATNPSTCNDIVFASSSDGRSRYLFVINNCSKPQLLDVHVGALGLTLPANVHVESVNPGFHEQTMQITESRKLAVEIGTHSVMLISF